MPAIFASLPTGHGDRAVPGRKVVGSRRGMTGRRDLPGRRDRPGLRDVTYLACIFLAVFVVTGLPTAAQAQVIQGADDHYKSPQHFALELRFGPYTPDVDSEFGGKRTPYKDFFGAGAHLMSQIEFDYQIIRHVGSLGLGVGVGYFSNSGRNTVLATGLPSDDTSTIKLIPFSLSAVYRFDLALERWGFPVVPYSKLGLDYAIWSINNGNGEVPSDPTGGTGHGGTWGWHGAVGLSLVLDFLDPTAAHQFDIESGINHTHVFVELDYWDLSGFGSASQLHVGDTTWMAGLLLEF
jgi:hypothetical protein